NYSIITIRPSRTPRSDAVSSPVASDMASPRVATVQILNKGCDVLSIAIARSSLRLLSTTCEESLLPGNFCEIQVDCEGKTTTVSIDGESREFEACQP